MTNLGSGFEIFEVFDDLLDEPVGGRGTGGDADGLDAFELGVIYLFFGLDEKAFLALLFADGEELYAV